MSNLFNFTEEEKNIILLGATQIIRIENGATITYTINSFGDVSYRYNIIRERIANNGLLDLRTIYINTINIIQTKYPALYNSLTTTSTSPQTINSTASYVVN
jgi:Iap family predicted aminopeptidase